MQEYLFLIHSAYWLLNVSLTVELAMVVMGKLVLRKPENDDGVVQKPTEAVMLMPVVEIDPRLECEICLLPFSEFTRIPRILKDCGHTICDGCARNLLKQNNNMHLFCPLCQTATVIQGFVDLLKTNHAVLEYIKESNNVQ